LIEAEIVSPRRLSALVGEINEIVAMTIASIRTIRSKGTVNPKSEIRNPELTYA
jgi:hypothetical protein